MPQISNIVAQLYWVRQALGGKSKFHTRRSDQPSTERNKNLTISWLI